ncbi:hypothetical protein QJS10_CPB15g00214 [Acorus calamus]|uniref:CCAAT-binding factor domain-containing protein n=1 Tax=Acorus calamus TaxID=4465 RepID=A0AAV9D4Q1_ACOCL|nr:hypothetical protein QJS10_CPB15g00214 [Acorus calamus]
MASPPPAKKPKRTKRSSSSSAATLDDLKTLGRELLSSRAHINNLPIILHSLSPSSPPDHSLEALITLQSFFTPLLPDIPSSSSPLSTSVDGGEKDPEKVYKAWLRSRFDEFVQALIDVVVSSETEDTLRDVVLDALMEFVKLGKGGKFQSAIYHRFLRRIVLATSSIDHLMDLLASRYFKYIDFRFFTYVSLNKIVKDCKSTNVTGLSSKKARKISSKISVNNNKVQESNNSQNDDVSAAHLNKKLKLKFTKAWISFLRLPLPVDVYKEVLSTLHQIVIPHISNPVMLCDFLTRSYDIGGVISVMALSSLFILMTQHGLEYPNFYEKLYALLNPSIFMAKHRGRFFQLLDSCLKSPLLPAYLAAAFAKKLSRLSLSVPPSGALVIVAVIHNLLRRHPSINFLVHRVVEEDTNGGVPKESNESGDNSLESSTSIDRASRRGIDYYNVEESNPVKSNAMRPQSVDMQEFLLFERTIVKEDIHHVLIVSLLDILTMIAVTGSSLWEIDTLRHHYCPAVSRFVASLENDLTIRAKTTEVAVKDFCSGSYSTIFREETRRRIKQVPLAFYQVTPTSLFSETDFPGWTFKDQLSDKHGLEINGGEILEARNGVVHFLQQPSDELKKSM